MYKKFFSKIWIYRNFILAGILCIGLFIIYSQDTPMEDGSVLEKNNDPTYEFVSTEHLSKTSMDSSLEYLELDRIRQESSIDETIYAVDADKPVRTNQWFSSLYFSDASELIFAYPLAVKFDDHGVQIGYPDIHVNPNIVFNVFTPDVVIDVQEKVASYLYSSSDLSIIVLLKSQESDKDIAYVTVTQGSPFVYVEMIAKDQKYSVRTKDVLHSVDDRTVAVSAPMHAKYGLFADSQFPEIPQDQDTRELSMMTHEKNSIISIGIAPQDVSVDALKPYALDPIIDTFAGFSLNEEEYENTLSYMTRGNKETLLALFSWQENDDVAGDAIGTLDTLRGQQNVFAGNSTQFRSGNSIPDEQLLVRDFPENRKATLRALIKQDVEGSTRFTTGDTYFHGKALLRTAQIYDMAMQLGMTEESTILHDRLVEDLERWRIQSLDKDQTYSDHYLTYDPQIKGIVGWSPSFGSERFNDHHFHYGYFLHSAAILGRHDEAFLEKNREFINLFAKDYVNHDRQDENFALLRNFDLYVGHSWASGMVPFGDGNNQESSSEAVHAYYAAYMWANVIEDEELENISLWLYNREIDSAKRYWFLYGDESPLYESYDHPLVSLLWGGKAEWATWFSADAEAKLGIQILPLHAGSTYLDLQGDEINAYLEETSFPQKGLFFDYLTMFYAFADPLKAESIFGGIEDADIDGGNSRSFMYAWISQRVLDNEKNE